MYRIGIRELNYDGTRLSKREYERSSHVVKCLVDSYIGYFGIGNFLELLSYPQTFNVLCVAAMLRPFTTSSIVTMLSILKDASSPSRGFAVVGGVKRQRFHVPSELERVGHELGLSSNEIEYLKYCSKVVAKIDDDAVQDGYRLWFHCMIVSKDADWLVIQIGSRSSLSRSYHWFSKRAEVVRFVDEPHTGIIAEAIAKEALDLTLKDNAALREAMIEVLKEPLSRLRSQKALAEGRQSKLTSFHEDGYGISSDQQFLQPLGKISWQTIEKLKSYVIRDFLGLLSIDGVGEQLLRFLAVSAVNLYDVPISFCDRAQLVTQPVKPIDPERVTGLFYEMLEAIKFSRLDAGQAKTIVAKVKNYWIETVGLN